MNTQTRNHLINKLALSEIAKKCSLSNLLDFSESLSNSQLHVENDSEKDSQEKYLISLIAEEHSLEELYKEMEDKNFDLHEAIGEYLFYLDHNPLNYKREVKGGRN